MNTNQYEGSIEHWDGKRITGWAYCKSDPDTILTLDIEVNGERIETISAGNFREDLFHANKGSGEHAFESGDLSKHLKNDSSVDAIQIFLSQTDLSIHRPIFLRRGKQFQFKCFFPWTTLNIRTNGDVYPCISSAWFNDGAGVVSNQRHQTLDDIWNGSPIKQVRKDFIEGNYDICRADICPYLNGEFKMKPPNRYVISAIAYPDKPLDIGVEELVHEVDLGCNLTCVMCRSKKVKIDSVTGHKVAKEIEGMAKKGDLKELRMSPAGEILMHQGIVRLLKSRTLSDNGVHISIITNLTLMNSDLWHSIKHNKITIQASIDGATKQTYEKIRKGAQWETVYKNLTFLVDVYRKGELHNLVVNMVVMGSNRHDLRGMIEMTKNLGIELFFIKHEGLSVLEDNVFDCCRIDILDEIYEEIGQSHGFELPHVHIGTAGILIDKYYRTIDYRMFCAKMQLSRYKRHDIAVRIVKECMDDIKSGTLEVNEYSLCQHKDFIEHNMRNNQNLNVQRWQFFNLSSTF